MYPFPRLTYTQVRKTGPLVAHAGAGRTFIFADSVSMATEHSGVVAELH